jgi:5-methyltetrahydropteroyltriglutamate--homocysteine methyltransferase
LRTSTDRIISSHVGSLPRPAELLKGIADRMRGTPFDQAMLQRAIGAAVRRQVEIGIDVVTDGEFSKPSFITYAVERLSGFEVDPNDPGSAPWAETKEAKSFPDYYAAPPPVSGDMMRRRRCIGPIRFSGQAQVGADIANLKSALQGLKVEEAFLPAISPSNVADAHSNAYYKTDEEYLFAIAEAMREEYKAIVDAGLILQVDDPNLVTHYVMKPDITVEDARRWAAVRVEAVNHALAGIPEDRVRFHTCYSINMGPRVHDMQLKDIVDLLLRIKAGAYSFEYGNPRHEHEWRVWKDTKLPDNKVLMPGVISNSTVLVEHPELVADRIIRFADIVGRERVIAGADCGFASFAANKEFVESVVWAKLEALAEGSRIASRILWKH